MELTTGMLIVFGLILLAGGLFAVEVVPNEMAALSILVLLVVFEPWTQVSPTEAISGFASPATVTIIAMFILSEGVRRTGVVRQLGRRMKQFTGRSETRHLVATLGLGGPLAGFVNNTPVVAVLIPTIVDLARTNRISASKLLIPLSYGSMLGGMLTLVGTASTILASDLSARLIDHPMGMFEFTPLGLIVLGVGTIYLLVVGPRLLPERIRPEEDLTAKFRMRVYLRRVRVREDSPLVGKTIQEGMRDVTFDMDILQIVRGASTYIGPFSDQTIAAHDVLTIRADETTRQAFVDRMHLELFPAQRVTDESFIDASHTLLECTIPPDSPLEQETLISSTFRTRYHGTVLAIRRGDTVIRDRVEAARLREGDSLLVQTTHDHEALLHMIPDLVVTRTTPAARQPGEEKGANRRRKMPIALGILAGVVAVAASGLYPIVITALAGVVLMVVTGCLKTEEAYAAVSWNIIFLLAGIIPLGIAMQNTGAAQFLAGRVLSHVDALPAIAVLGAFYLLTALLANVIGNNASVIIMLPIAVDAAHHMAANPFAFVLAVTFAASTAFMTPVGYQTNLMVYTPGGYRFADFVRVGAPLQLLLTVVTTLGIALIWGV
jgi:di/tricarboxylate transporter